MNNGPHAQYWRTCSRSCASSVPSTGSADTTTNPTVIAARCIARSSRVRPRGRRSNTRMPPASRGRWNVSAPATSPSTVFGSVQTNPSQVGTAAR